MDRKKRNVPKIRFPEFTDEWEQHKLDKAGSFEKSIINTQDFSDINFMEYSMPSFDNNKKPEVVLGNTMQSNRLKIEGTVLLINKLNVRQKRIWLVENAPKNSVASSEFMPFTSDTLNLEFLQQLMLSDKATLDLEALSSGTSNSQKRVNPSDFLKYEIFVPKKIKEQSEIGKFLRNFDSLITLHQRKLDHLKELKKGLLQKMFPKKGASVPEIRFAGFTDAWEQRKLGEIAVRVQGNDGRMDIPTLTISAANGWMKQEDRFSGNIAGKEQKNYTLLHKGELAYNHGNSKLAKYGTVFSLQTYKEALVPRVYHSFRIDEGNADFIEYYFATKIPDRELSKLISSGARMDGLLNIGFDEFMGIEMVVPSVDEQVRISDYFRSFDNLITLHQRKLDHLKELKKGLLQQMFV